MSGRRFLLDTNVVIGLAQGPGAARDLLDASGAVPSTSAISQIARIELFSSPLLTAAEEVRLRQFIIPFDVPDAQRGDRTGDHRIPPQQAAEAAGCHYRRDRQSARTDLAHP
jgi:predicted nucleic acid-binding protein